MKIEFVQENIGYWDGGYKNALYIDGLFYDEIDCIWQTEALIRRVATNYHISYYTGKSKKNGDWPIHISDIKTLKKGNYTLNGGYIK